MYCFPNHFISTTVIFYMGGFTDFTGTTPVLKVWITHERPVEDQTLCSKKDNIIFDRFHFTVSVILQFYRGDQIF